jgi:GT2 family glycosyltransferase
MMENSIIQNLTAVQPGEPPVVCIIVTYGNRSVFTLQVIQGCRAQQVQRIYLVDNASDAESASKYDDLVIRSTDIELIRLSENLGSAGGFKAGLDALTDLSTDTFVWLLDDDTVPMIDAKRAMMAAWTLAECGTKLVLYSNRIQRTSQTRFYGNGYVSRYYPNNFMGFNGLRYLKQKLTRKKMIVNCPLVRTEFGPYGGLFTTISTLQQIGFPLDSLFTYADDHEFTLRFHQVGIPQFRVYHSKLIDVDHSFESGGVLDPKQGNSSKTYYTIRNHTWLSQRFIHHRWIYQGNKILYTLRIILKYLSTSSNRPLTLFEVFRSINVAIHDGEVGRLGKRIAINELKEQDSEKGT